MTAARAELIENLAWLADHPATEGWTLAGLSPGEWWATFRASVTLYRARLGLTTPWTPEGTEP